jgi:MoaA/NifB/PqqE/SkfB family radical SAM enzyme
MGGGMPFKKICFEVAGACNGRCRYCVTGAKNANPGGFMEADAFDATLRDLERLHLIDSQTLVDLFNWGELFLHPDLQNIIRVINDHNLRYSISTNASVVPRIDEAFAKNLISIFFSMCGFSQQSYDRIHKFEFEDIKRNIGTIVSDLRSSGYKKRIQILFHVYRFNVGELRECQRFANDLGISLAFYDAYVNDWWQLEALVHNTLPNEKRREMLDDLFIGEALLSNAPKGWRCPQWDLMVIDERGNVPVCCNLPNNHPSYSLGAVDNGIANRLQNRPNLPICETCMESGMSYFTHHIRFKGDPSILKLAWRQIASRMRREPRELFGLPEVIDLVRQGTEWIYLLRKQ